MSLDTADQNAFEKWLKRRGTPAPVASHAASVYEFDFEVRRAEEPDGPPQRQVVRDGIE